MSLLYFNPFFDEAMIRAISRTLVHSLWQGMLLAIIAGLIVFFTKRSSAAVRYNLLTGTLLIFIVGIAFTFYRQIVLSSVVEFPLTELQPGAATIKETDTNNNNEFNHSIATTASQFFNQYADWIVFGWLCIILLKCMQLGGGLYNIHRLKTRQTFSVGDHWNKRIIELCHQIKVNTKVRLLQSGIARVPAVVGYLKPVILFPAGMLASLPPHEVEAILLHELAHIRRKDYLVNVLQHIVEIVFFFNPAVRWVSSLIRTERENCCDDIAVGQTNNKRNYINALIAFQDARADLSPSLAHAFAGEKNHLVNRVKRIIYNNNKTLNNMEKKLLAAGLVVTGLFIFAFTSNGLQHKVTVTDTMEQIIPEVKTTGSQLITIPDTIPGRKKRSHSLNGTINTSLNGKEYKIIADDGKVTELYVDGKKIPADKMGEYSQVTGQIIKQSKEDMMKAEEDMEQAQKDMEQAEQDMAEAQKEILQSKIEMEKAQEQMEQDMEHSKKDMELSKIELEQAKKEMAESKLEMEQAAKQMKEDMQQAKIDMERSKQDMAQAKKDMAQAKLDIEQSKKDMAESKRIQQGVVADFIKYNLIKDKSELSSYRLSDEELIINGVKQSEEMHKKFKDKYVKNKHWQMNYNNE